MKVSKELINFVKHIALLANTPAFLYNTLRGNDSVIHFAEESSTTSLVKELTNIANKKKKSAYEIAMIYLILVSLSYKDDFNASQLLKIDLSEVEWYYYLASYISAITTTTNIESTYPTIKSSPRILDDSETTPIVHKYNIEKVPQNVL